ncbi:flagellar basal body rod protein FlgB [Geobacter hydrogenophilus]|uniref:Flagellar basal body rod protein FlgB n=1 Tax=Geobacter hydrogenophilus TaxID=40983 RepID=A0A9W6FZ98_9BACT|nr:flagellar basal body rod protein FlgB [Geobacter hydrogenophilus]MBT0893688.1 flagellar basal body rod protein FlgB [Geobacter hydrogenophilus]GLI37616.1 flagellar basal body rod protein FlgB [Geobacter hydrogenophilus]
MPIDKIFGTTVDLLAKSIDLRSRSHTMISANLANVETPNYTPTALSFENELRGALKGKNTGSPAVTHPKHIPLKGQSNSIQQVQGTVVETPSLSPGKDNNGVELEAEMSRMAENQIMYNASIQILSKQFNEIKSAIRENK